MLSKSKQKWIKSLERKRVRDKEGFFVAEGKKTVTDLLSLLKCRFLMATPEYYHLIEQFDITETVEVSEDEYKKASFQKSPQGMLAVFEKPSDGAEKLKGVTNSLVLALNDVQDPGNLGTIIRLADWYGIHHLVCSPHTADAYSPKAVQASMGAIGRVNIHYTDLLTYLSSAKGKIPIFGTFMQGKNIYKELLPNKGIIIFGNEGNGISETIAQVVDSKLYIPAFSETENRSESLNVGIAAAIVISEFKRNNFS